MSSSAKGCVGSGGLDVDSARPCGSCIHARARARAQARRTTTLSLRGAVAAGGHGGGARVANASMTDQDEETDAYGSTTCHGCTWLRPLL